MEFMKLIKKEEMKRYKWPLKAKKTLIRNSGFNMQMVRLEI